MKKIILFIAIVSVSCGNFSKRLNQQEDIDKGKAVVDKFYAGIKSGSFGDAAKLFGGEVVPAEAEKLLVSQNEIEGALQNVEFDSGKSMVTEENNEITGEIDLYYKVKFANADKNEDFVLKFVDNELLIAGYHTNVPGSKNSK